MGDVRIGHQNGRRAITTGTAGTVRVPRNRLPTLKIMPPLQLRNFSG
ncbi:hypothetical protein OSTOST_24009, partial [Ostertagia ostertagi]